MILDEDTTLLSFFENFCDPEDHDELIANIIKYVGGGKFGNGQTEETHESTEGEFDDVSI